MFTVVSFHQAGEMGRLPVAPLILNKTKKMKTKKVTISLTEEQQQQAKEISKELLGKENISGLFAFWINQHLKKRSKPY